MEMALVCKMLTDFMTLQTAQQLVDDTTLRTAQQLVDDINKNFRSPHQLIDRTRNGPFRLDSFEKYYNRFGDRFIQYLHYQMDLQRVIHAIEKTFKDHSELNFATAPFKTLATYLVISKFGIGSDGAVAAQGWVETVRKAHSIFIETTSFPNRYSSPQTHAFVILGVDEKEFLPSTKRGVLIHDALKSLNEGILLDPALGYACPVSKFESSPLIPFNQLWETHYISGIFMGNLSTSHFESFMKKVDAIYKAAKKVAVSGANQEISSFITKKYNVDIGPRVLSTLKKLYPNPHWRQEIKHCKLTTSARGSPQDLDAIAAELGEYEIKAEAEDHTITLINTDPEKLERAHRSIQRAALFNRVKILYPYCKSLFMLGVFSVVAAKISTFWSPIETQH